MTEQEFREQDLCEWEPDPVMKEVVAFVRYATEDEIRDYKQAGIVTHKQVVEAKRIIEQEAH